MASDPRPRKVLRGKIKKVVETQYDNLLTLTLQVYAHYPEIKTRNPYQRTIDRLLKCHGHDVQQLFHKVVHSLTVLYHVVRYQNKSGQYESSREDVVSALQLLKNQIDPMFMLTRGEKLFYNQLHHHFTNQAFTRKQVQHSLEASKSRVHHKLNKLYHANLLHRTGHTNTGYRYQLK